SNFGAGFNAAAFREAITNVMMMGLPPDQQQQATFQWRVERSYEAEDADGLPYDFSAVPTSETTHEDVRIPVAVEFAARPAGSLDTSMGQFDTSRAILTILDTHYPQVATATHVLL